MSYKVFFKRSISALLSVIFLTSTVFSIPVVVNAEPEYNFAKALQLSLYFYDANKCGPGVTGGRLEWRGDCHVEDKELPLIPMTESYRGTNLSQSFIDKYKDILDPDGNGSLDLTGGMHDAGDHVKFGLPQTYAASTVGWGFYEFKDAYVNVGEEEHVRDILRWFNDYFLRSTFRDADGNVIAFCYQVGEGDIDHDYWNPPELQNSTMIKDFERPAYFATAEKPASDQCAGAAASLAVNYLNFKDEDPEYAQECLDTAIALYDFAREYRGLGYSGGFYTPSYDYDELAWAAVWLNIATGKQEYIDHIIATDAAGKYIGYMQRIIVDTGNDWQNIWTHCWDTVWGGVFAKLAPITDTERDWYIFKWNLEYWSGITHDDGKDTNFLAKTPAGFSMLNSYGSARYNASAQLCALVYRKETGRADFADWAKGQMEYIMGNNPMKRAYIVGYAPDGASHPHHRASHGSKTLSMDNPVDQVHTLWGALVGGPDAEDFHKDITADYIYNEVAVDYNASFVGACAGFYNYYGEGHEPIADFPPKETRPQEFFVEAKVEQENTERTQVTIRIHNETAYPPRYETGMKARYYFNVSELINAGQSIDDVQMEIYYDENGKSFDGNAKCSGPIKYDDSGTYYVEFDWEGRQIYAARELQFALVAAQDKNFKSNWNPANDYSRQGLVKEYTSTTKVPFYVYNVLMFGEEPKKVSPTPTPTQDPNSSATPTSITDTTSLKVLYKCVTLAGSTSDIRAVIKIKNDGTTPVNLADVKAQYWFTADTVAQPVFSCDFAHVSSDKVTGEFIKPSTTKENADRYLQIGFAEDAGVLGAGTDTGEIIIRIANDEVGSFSQLNDYSYQPLAKDFAENEKITATFKAVKVYGTEPVPFTTPQPTPTAAVRYGDLNGDTKINSIDFAVLRQYLLGIIKEFSVPKESADLNGDGMVNSIDFANYRMYLLGMIREFPVNKIK